MEVQRSKERIKRTLGRWKKLSISHVKVVIYDQPLAITLIEGTEQEILSTMKKYHLPGAKGWGFGSGLLAGVGSLLHNIFEIEVIVEKVAGTTFERIAPTIDLFGSAESLESVKRNSS